MKKSLLVLSFLFLIPVLSFAGFVWPATLHSHVNDFAGMFSNRTIGKVSVLLKNLESKDSTQIVVITVSSLEGKTIEDLAIEIGNKYKIGQKGIDNGVLILFSKLDRKWRVEVGPGLQGKLTDQESAQIMNEKFVPFARLGRMDDGLLAATNAIVSKVSGEYTAPAKKDSSEDNVLAFIAIGFVVLFILIITAVIITHFNRKKREILEEAEEEERIRQIRQLRTETARISTKKSDIKEDSDNFSTLATAAAAAAILSSSHEHHEHHEEPVKEESSSPSSRDDDDSSSGGGGGIDFGGGGGGSFDGGGSSGGW
jgi:uncharacterized protein